MNETGPAGWVDRMIEIAAKEPASVVLVLADLVKETATPTTAFVAELAGRVQARGPTLGIAMSWLEHRIAEQGQTIDQIFQQTSQSQAAAQVSIGNSIGSLRFLGATDWREFVETVSVVEATLRTDPSGVYPRMDFGTRDRYRHVVEEIAKGSSLSENEVAKLAVEEARRAGGTRPGWTLPASALATSATSWSTAAGGIWSGRPGCDGASGRISAGSATCFRFPCTSAP